MNNLYRYYSSDIYCMNNLISEDMLSMLHWLPCAAQKWLVCSNVRNALAEWFCQAIHSIHERSPNLVDTKKISEICVEMNQWTVKKSSHTQPVSKMEYAAICNQVNIWSGLVSSAQEQTPQFLHKTKEKQNYMKAGIECLRIISGKCHVLPMMNLSIFFSCTLRSCTSEWADTKFWTPPWFCSTQRCAPPPSWKNIQKWQLLRL